jgi:hypothetical protein
VPLTDCQSGTSPVVGFAAASRIFWVSSASLAQALSSLIFAKYLKNAGE